MKTHRERAGGEGQKAKVFVFWKKKKKKVQWVFPI
jgi:hypothetical protein